MLKVEIEINHLNYENVADKLLPGIFDNHTEEQNWSMKMANWFLVKDGEASKAAKGILKILPQRVKDNIAFDLVFKNKSKILESINENLEIIQIPVTIIEIDIKESNRMEDDKLKLEFVLNEIDYNAMVENTLPRLLQSMSEKGDKLGNLAQVLLKMEEIPKKMIIAALNILPQEGKDDLLINVLSIYKEDIVQVINRLTKEQQISAEIADINIMK